MGGRRSASQGRTSSLEEVRLKLPCPQCTSTNTWIKTGLKVIGPAPRTIGGVAVKATFWPYTVCGDCDYVSRRQRA